MTAATDRYSLDPAGLMAAIDADARALDTCGKELGAAIKHESQVRAIHEEATEKALIELRDEAKRDGERLPGMDMLRALAHRRVDSRVYGEALAAKAQVEALRAWSRALEASVSARQSLLRAMTSEAA